MIATRFEGLAVALATPFTDSGELDLPGFRRLVGHVRAGGVDVLVVLGTTGESATLDEDERDLLVRTALEEARGRPVVAGTGHNATRRAAAWTARAQELGCAGALVVAPYYNKPTQRGLLEHFRAVADAAPGFPLIAYNVPGRTAVNVAPATASELWKLDSVVALKESSGSLAQISEIARTLPAGKLLLAGDDSLALPSIAVGAEGLVSVVANVLPGPTARLVAAARAGHREEARAMHARLLPVIDALFCESSPIPLKAALRELGLCGDRLRLPLTSPEAETRARVADALRPFRE